METPNQTKSIQFKSNERLVLLRWEGETAVSKGKSPGAEYRTNKLWQNHTCSGRVSNPTRATLEEGECSHHNSKLAPYTAGVQSISQLTLFDVLPKNFYIEISVGAWLFVPETECMHYLMQDSSLVVATISQGKLLANSCHPILTTYRRPTSNKETIHSSGQAPGIKFKKITEGSFRALANALNASFIIPLR